MKRVLMVLLCAMAVVAVGDVLAGEPPSLETLSLLPMAFTLNQGQWPKEVKYQARAQGATLWFTGDGVQYQFFRRKDDERAKASSAASEIHPIHKAPQLESMMIKATLVGGRTEVAIEGTDLMEYKCNYFKGNDSTRWRTDVPNYQSITYENVYDGIDLKYYGTGRQMEYDFIVKPGADPSQVNVQYEGAEDIAVNYQGDLIVKTAWGTIIEAAPTVYQQTAQGRRALDGSFVMTGDRQVGFRINSTYDAALAVVIDPTLVFSTYLGGASGDFLYDIGVNTSGQVYVAGNTLSGDYPYTAGGYDGTLGGTSDVVLTKINASGSSLAWSTFLGGGSSEDCTAMDASLAEGIGVFLTGTTSSTDFPTANALDATLAGINDLFVASIGSGGNILLFSTMFGGSGFESGGDIAVRCTPPCFSPVYTAVISGSTLSTDFPLKNAYQLTEGGGYDAVLFKLDVSPIGPSYTLNYSTYYGGTADDEGDALAMSPSTPYKPYLLGSTGSSNLPGITGYDTSLGGLDAFVTQFSVAGNGSVYASAGTYFGGSSSDQGTSAVFRNFNELCITGVTTSAGLATPGAFDTSYSTGFSTPWDQYVTDLSADLTTRNWTTYLGGTGNDYTSGHGLAVDKAGNLCIAGITGSSDFPVKDSLQPNQAGQDVFVARLNGTGTAMSFGTYLGGSADEIRASIAVDTSGCMYVAGHTQSTDFPMVSPYDGTAAGGEGFVSKICASLSCCVGTVGNVDCSAGDGVDVGDLTALIDNLFINFTPLCCDAEANCDGAGGIDVGDLTSLIDNLFINFTPLPACQ